MEQIIKQYIEKQIFLGTRTVQVDESLLSEGAIDSMNTIKLISFLENEFSISIDMNELTEENFNTISKIVTLVKSKRSSG